MTPVCRFAPSPNGPLHLGHAYSALRNQAVARRDGGRLLLRMENIDLARCPPANEAAIAGDLAWLGLAWDTPVRRQSEHLALYGAALATLEAGGLLYPCFCTRGDVLRAIRDRPGWPHDPDGAPLYPGTCRALGARERARRVADGTAFSLRLDGDLARRRVGGDLAWSEYGEGAASCRIAARSADWGDPVLRRKDVPASYHIAVVVDDAEQSVSDVVRGTDLYAATSLHRLLQALLGLPAPRYHHHRLIAGADGRKLSKSRGAPALGDLRRAGLTPDDVGRLIEAALALRPMPQAGEGGAL